MDFIAGVISTAVAFCVGIFLFNVGGWSTATDIKRQCETQQSIRLVTGSGEAVFYCTREPKK